MKTLRLFRISLLLVLFVSMFLTLPVKAESSINNKVKKKNVKKEDENVNIVVTGTRTEHLYEDSPVPVEVITRKDIEKKGSDSLYEILEDVPSIIVERQCSNCNFSQVRIYGLSSGNTLLLIDGLPVFSGLASVYGLDQIPASAIERVEVVKGSSSALYGSSASGGVINVILREPGKKPKTELFTKFGSKSTNRYSIYNSGRKGNLGWMLSGQATYNGAIDANKNNYTDRCNTDNKNFTGRVFLKDIFSKKDKATLTYSYYNEFRKGGYLPRWDDPLDPDSEHIKTRRNEIGFTYKKKFKNQSNLKFNIYYGRHKRNATNSGLSFFARENFYLFDIAHSLWLNSKNLVTVGGQFKKDELDEILNGGYSTKSASDYAFFAQDEIELSNKLSAVAGIRYDHHKSNDSITKSSYNTSAVNPRLSLMFKPNRYLTHRFSIGTGYRVPFLFSEDLHLCASSPRILKPAGLIPEKSMSLSLDNQWKQGKNNWNLNLFWVKIRDKLEIDVENPPIGYDGVWQNFGTATSKGVELGYDRQINENFNFRSGYTYTNALYDSERYPGESWSKYVPRSPEHRFNTGLFYKSKKGWKANFTARYEGQMYIDHEGFSPIVEKTDPYWICNFRMEKKFKKSNMTYFAGVNNIFNYTQKRRDLNDAAYIWAPLYGRTIYGGIKYEL